MRIAENHGLATLDLLFQQLEVYLKVFSVFAFFQNKRAIHFLATGICHLVCKRIINRREDQNLISRLGETSERMGDSHNDSGHESQLVLGYCPSIAVLEPGDNGIIPLLGTASVSQNPSVNPLYESVSKEFRGGKIHIGDPHRQKILLAPD